MKESNEESNGSWAMARVNMFLRMRSDGICAMESKGLANISNLIDISENWFPSEEDFIKADIIAIEEAQFFDDLYEFTILVKR